MGVRSRRRSADIATVVSGVLRGLSICAPVALLDVAATLAQASESTSLLADIPAQPLAQALAAFGRQTGLQLIYVSSVIGNQRSQAVAAGLKADEALAHLLQGTGLRFEHLTPRSIRIFVGVVAPPAITPRILTGEERDEVIITANRRVENLQDVPITVQAITGDQLNQLNVATTYDLLKYTPNVTYSGNGPGTGNLFIRGLGSYGSGNQSQSTIAPFPNVALYLDDQSMQFPARNNDVYLVDMERVEVLEGPQGTLLGGGAQVGAIRYITNKPNLTATSADFNAGWGITADGGGQNSMLNATLNVPLIADTVAMRAVVFSDHQGGYISNVPGTIGYLPNSPQVLAGVNPIANNASLRQNDSNPVNYEGFRLSGLFRINDDWNVLLQQNYQDMRADGYFYAYPTASDGQALQPYQITAFTPAYNKDRYESTSWTLNGKIHDLSIVYTGSYMVRHIEGQQDYSNYLRSVTGSYYGCIGPGAGYFNPANFPSLAGHKLQCYAPVGNWEDTVANPHQSHELRVSTNPDSRIRALFGVYWEKFVIDDEMNFNYLVIPQCDPANLAAALSGGPACLSAVGAVPGSFATDPSLRIDEDNAFGEDAQRGYKQTAEFASVDFDMIPKALTLSGGTRHYHYDEFEEGSEWYSETSTNGLILNHANGACIEATTVVPNGVPLPFPPGLCGWPFNLRKSESGYRSRGNLTWHITPDTMAYYTFSQGFRPGGFNRTKTYANGTLFLNAAAPYSSAPNTNQYEVPAGYSSDNLINNEVGFKSEFLDHHVLFNLSAYYMKWENSQLLVSDPVHVATFIANGASYNVKGFEVQFVARIAAGLTVQGSSSVNSLSQSSSPCLTSAGVDPNNFAAANNPTPKGQCITQINGAPYSIPFGQLGTRPAFSPPWQFELRARYDWAAWDYKPFAWVGASHIASMSNEPANFPNGNAPSESPPIGWPTTAVLRYQIPGYTTCDGALGVAKDNWTVQLQGHNLSNAYGPTNVSSAQYIKAEIPLRPRVITFLIGYRF
jgi:iron complex outermembrane receptor protein